MNWKKIKNYNGQYEISDRGDVRSFKGKKPRLLKPVKHGAGYLAVNLYSGKKSTVVKRYVHDLVAEAFIGPKPAGLTVNHKDGDKKNNTVANLEYLSLSDNLRHAHRTGLINNQGENNGMAKLTEPDVYVICSGLCTGRAIGETAQSFNVSFMTVWSIWAGKTWTHCTGTFGQFIPSGLI